MRPTDMPARSLKFAMFLRDLQTTGAWPAMAERWVRASEKASFSILVPMPVLMTIFFSFGISMTFLRPSFS